MQAFGLRSPWLLWQITNGGLNDMCSRCNGAGVVIRSPCARREIAVGAFAAECNRKTGCEKCRRICPECKGERVTEAEVHAEDFGDAESRALADRVLSVVVNPEKRSDMDAPALR